VSERALCLCLLQVCVSSGNESLLLCFLSHLSVALSHSLSSHYASHFLIIPALLSHSCLPPKRSTLRVVGVSSFALTRVQFAAEPSLGWIWGRGTATGEGGMMLTLLTSLLNEIVNPALCCLRVELARVSTRERFCLPAYNDNDI
jgi:hypothetical protein